MTTQLIRSWVAAAVLIAGVMSARPALAGPPLLCHPFDTGGARSLPWGDGDSRWDAVADYDTRHLVADTEALLTPSVPVIARMETLRRAAIYASRDAGIAARLLAALVERARAAERAGRPDAIAFLDAAYMTEALRQVSMLRGIGTLGAPARGIADVVGGADGYASVLKSLALRPDDPSLEFAAALIASGSHRSAYATHAAKARAGAQRNALLVRNIALVIDNR